MWPESVQISDSSFFPLHQTDKKTLEHVCDWLTTSEGLINTFSRSSDSLWLCPRCCCTSCNTTLQHLQTHTHNLFIRQTDTPSLPSICMQSFTAAQQIVAELLQYAACLGEQGGRRGEEETWKWVKAFRRRPQHRARSNSAVLALRRSITAFHCRHASCKTRPPAGAKSYLGRSTHAGAQRCICQKIEAGVM